MSNEIEEQDHLEMLNIAAATARMKRKVNALLAKSAEREAARMARVAKKAERERKRQRWAQAERWAASVDWAGVAAPTWLKIGAVVLASMAVGAVWRAMPSDDDATEEPEEPVLDASGTVAAMWRGAWATNGLEADEPLERDDTENLRLRLENRALRRQLRARDEHDERDAMDTGADTGGASPERMAELLLKRRIGGGIGRERWIELHGRQPGEQDFAPTPAGRRALDRWRRGEA